MKRLNEMAASRIRGNMEDYADKIKNGGATARDLAAVFGMEDVYDEGVDSLNEKERERADRMFIDEMDVDMFG